MADHAPKKPPRDSASAPAKDSAPEQTLKHAPAVTSRPETPELEGVTPLPEELTGRAAGTGDDLTKLFDNDSADHFTDGFRGGSDDDQNVRTTDDGGPDEDGATGG